MIKKSIRNTPKFNTNTSGYKGVTWHKQVPRWEAAVSVNNKCISLGVYDNILDAAKAAQEYYNEFYNKED